VDSLINRVTDLEEQVRELKEIVGGKEDYDEEETECPPSNLDDDDDYEDEGEEVKDLVLYRIVIKRKGRPTKYLSDECSWSNDVEASCQYDKGAAQNVLNLENYDSVPSDYSKPRIIPVEDV
jgi:hypothetical protein